MRQRCKLSFMTIFLLEVLRSSRPLNPCWILSQGPSSQLVNSQDPMSPQSPRTSGFPYTDFSRTTLHHLHYQAFGSNVTRSHSLWYNLDGHTTNIIGVISQDYKALSIQWCVQAPSDKRYAKVSNTKSKLKAKH